MTHSDIPPDRQAELGITPAMIRLSVGVEHPEDLIADLAQALEEVGPPEPSGAAIWGVAPPTSVAMTKRQIRRRLAPRSRSSDRWPAAAVGREMIVRPANHLYGPFTYTKGP